jgi:hypothetical protein
MQCKRIEIMLITRIKIFDYFSEKVLQLVFRFMVATMNFTFTFLYGSLEMIR